MLLRREVRVDAVGGGTLIISFPRSGVIMWEESGTGVQISQAFVHCDTGASCIPKSIDILGVWERYPCRPSEPGVYCYIGCRNQQALLKTIHELSKFQRVLPYGDGPVIVDIPILPFREIDNAVGYKQYLSNRVPGTCARYDKLLSLYTLAEQQYRMFPGGLKDKMRSYGDIISHEVSVYTKLAQ